MLESTNNIQEGNALGRLKQQKKNQVYCKSKYKHEWNYMGHGVIILKIYFFKDPSCVEQAVHFHKKKFSHAFFNEKIIYICIIKQFFVNHYQSIQVIKP